ncbi:MAG: AbrB/MazE/SpoVT family DNA-binding domain-containing protein [Deltaproteobacteria bacterium]|nr:AbrB/MazE/SpoVT family DNA-binding domain-containing protein [Deltaproteobacteria bacterium]
MIVSEKGQVTIPKALRDGLGIHPGQVLDFYEKNGHLVAAKLMPEGNPVDSVYGILDLKKTTDDLIPILRGEKDAV